MTILRMSGKQLWMSLMTAGRRQSTMDDADGRTAPRERKEDRRREKIFDDVIRIISNALEISPTEIKSDIDFNSEFTFDSLQLYEFVIDLEEAYNVRISDEDLDNVRNIDDIVDLICNLTNKD